MKQPIDSLIFDMDGTLWDAVPSYCKVWDATARSMGISRPPVRYDELVRLMGKPLAEIYKEIMGGYCTDADAFLTRLYATEEQLMPRLGGKLYPGVRSTIEVLSRHARLFMISNCAGGGLDNFQMYTRLKPYFIDSLTYGDTGVDKDVNIRTLIERYNLKRPVYVGDIQRDCDSTHAAGIEFVWAAYGFGKVVDADFRIDCFDQLLTLPIIG